MFRGYASHAPPSLEGEALLTSNCLQGLSSFAAAAPFLNSHARAWRVLKGQPFLPRKLKFLPLVSGIPFFLQDHSHHT